jgi:hypothetical protein
VETGPALKHMVSMNEPIERLSLEALRALTVCLRLEKSSLRAEISSASTTRLRKTEAIVRYSAVVTELRKVASDLERLRGWE